MLEIGGKAGTTRMNTVKAPLQIVPTACPHAPGPEEKEAGAHAPAFRLSVVYSPVEGPDLSKPKTERHCAHLKNVVKGTGGEPSRRIESSSLATPRAVLYCELSRLPVSDGSFHCDRQPCRGSRAIQPADHGLIPPKLLQNGPFLTVNRFILGI